MIGDGVHVGGGGFSVTRQKQAEETLLGRFWHAVAWVGSAVVAVLTVLVYAEQKAEMEEVR